MIGKRSVDTSDTSTLDPLNDFKNSGNQGVMYESIVGGDGIVVQGNVDPKNNNLLNIDVGLKSIGKAGTHRNPSSVTVNKYGQVTAITEASPQGPFTIEPVPNSTDIVIHSPHSISSTGAKNSWSGRWATKEVFNGPVSLSFRPTVGRALVGFSTTRDISGNQYMKFFDVGFYLDSNTFGIIKNHDRSVNTVPAVMPLPGTWKPTDTFSLSFTGSHVIYYLNGKKLFSEKRSRRVPLYAAGAFFTTKTPQTLSSIVIEDLLPKNDETPPVQPIVRSITNESECTIRSGELPLTYTTIETTIPGNISVWGTVDATGPLGLKICIKNDDYENIYSAKVDKHGTLFFSTDAFVPPDHYNVSLRAVIKDDAESDSETEAQCEDDKKTCGDGKKACGEPVKIHSARLMVMGNLC